MDNLESNPPAEPPAYPAQPESDSLSAAYESLRQVVLFMLVLIILISLTFNFYLLRQVRASRQQLDAVQQQVNAITSQFQMNVAPAMEQFYRRVTDFSRTNADFKPVLDRHAGDMGAATAPGQVRALPPPAANKK